VFAFIKDSVTMSRGILGVYHTTVFGGETVRAFVPAPLPPIPPIDLAGARQRLLEQATLAVGRLDSASTLLPETQHFLYAYVRREARLGALLPSDAGTCLQSAD